LSSEGQLAIAGPIVADLSQQEPVGLADALAAIARLRALPL